MWIIDWRHIGSALSPPPTGCVSADVQLTVTSAYEMSGDVLKWIDESVTIPGVGGAAPESGVFPHQQRGASEKTSVKVRDKTQCLLLLWESYGGRFAIAVVCGHRRWPLHAGNFVSGT